MGPWKPNNYKFINMNSFWGGVFSDVDGSFSFKRVQTAVFTVLFAAVVIVNLLSNKLLDEGILNLLAGLTAYGYTGIMIEKFTNRGIDKQ